MAKKKVEVPADCLPKCEACTFVLTEPGNDAGYCRRYPPVVLPCDDGEYSTYPVIELNDWCGEFIRRVN